jgi:hypothetical protein
MMGDGATIALDVYHYWYNINFGFADFLCSSHAWQVI